MKDVNFYSKLHAVKLSLPGLFREEYFQHVPASWHVVVADVKNSTQTVAAGRHNDVNLIAAGSLIAAINVARQHKVEIPFFFGGDGSTLLVPQPLLTDVLASLMAHNRNTQKVFDLQLHIGSVPVSELRDSGHSLRIAKWAVDHWFSKAVVVGNGLQYAEEKIKQSLPDGAETTGLNYDLNMTGLECRWDKIKPPLDEAENVCYLIEAVHPEAQLVLYRDVIQQIEAVYGDVQMRNPLSAGQLKLVYGLQKLRNEMLVKFGRWKPFYFIQSFLRSFLGRLYFKYNWLVGGIRGQDYLSELIAHADTLTIDGRINTIICGTGESHNKFLAYLSQQEEAGHLIFGHHASKESIMTCYVENRNAKHVHFVDGADGGYTEAAKEFKAKLKKLQVG